MAEDITDELAELAFLLRLLRSEAGVTYDELAERTGVSAATLKRAASGGAVPALKTVRVFAQACIGDGQEWAIGRAIGKWRRARVVERGRLRSVARPVHPTLVETRGELSAALVYHYEAGGAPSLRDLQEMAGGAHLLPVSTAARIVTRQSLPASRQQCEAFLAACGVTKGRKAQWGEAWSRVTRSEHARADERKTQASERREAIDRRLARNAPAYTDPQGMAGLVAGLAPAPARGEWHSAWFAAPMRTGAVAERPSKRSVRRV
ncbi:helix-turn-helix domain-containing protein [Streptomyces sp. NPDC091268]|uniref:helix-turn-helix domain-containing protein n=1 Tax=Streptomyces sp. NPDC091268 TaxID=3365979 RepID=UPI003817ACCF